MRLEGRGMFGSATSANVQEIEEATERFLTTRQPFMDEREQVQDNEARVGQFLGRLVATLHAKGQLTDDEVASLFDGEFVKAE